MEEKKYYLLNLSHCEDPKLIFESQYLPDVIKISKYLKDTLENNEMFFITTTHYRYAKLELISDELICEILNN